MVIGQTVYTVNNATNKVDTWTYAGVMKTKDDLLLELHDGNKTMWLPKRCVFATELEARVIANAIN